MLIVGVVGGVLLWREKISLFLFEIVVFLLFIVFWFVQTIELLPKPTKTDEPPAANEAGSGRTPGPRAEPSTSVSVQDLPDT
jgi:hypothetical protein